MSVPGSVLCVPIKSLNALCGVRDAEVVVHGIQQELEAAREQLQALARQFGKGSLEHRKFDREVLTPIDLRLTEAEAKVQQLQRQGITAAVQLTRAKDSGQPVLAASEREFLVTIEPFLASAIHAIGSRDASETTAAQWAGDYCHAVRAVCGEVGLAERHRARTLALTCQPNWRGRP